MYIVLHDASFYLFLSDVYTAQPLTPPRHTPIDRKCRRATPPASLTHSTRDVYSGEGLHGISLLRAVRPRRQDAAPFSPVRLNSKPPCTNACPSTRRPWRVVRPQTYDSQERANGRLGRVLVVSLKSASATSTQTSQTGTSRSRHTRSRPLERLTNIQVKHRRRCHQGKNQVVKRRVAFLKARVLLSLPTS